MMEVVVIVFVILLYMKSKIDRSIINDFLVVMGPYVAIASINNYFMVRYLGFFPIKNEALTAILIGLCAYFCGSVFGSKVRIVRSSAQLISSDALMSTGEHGESNYFRLSLATNYMLIVVLMRVVNIAYIIMTNGMSTVARNDYELLNLSGLVGHLVLTLYGVVPIVLYESIQQKYIKGLVVSFLAIFSLFLTFVKYDVILIVLITGLYFIARDRRYIKKVFLAMIIGIIAIFFSNYLILLFGSSISLTDQLLFITSHLWMYISNGVAMMNYTIGNPSINCNILDFAVQSLSPLPNMVFSWFSDYRILPANTYEALLITEPLMSKSGERGNAISLLATLYSNGNHIVSFVVMLFLIGIVCSYLLKRHKMKNKYRVSMVEIVVISVFMLSFFGNYWALSGPWEIIIYAGIFPRLFDKHSRLRIG